MGEKRKKTVLDGEATHSKRRKSGAEADDRVDDVQATVDGKVSKEERRAAKAERKARKEAKRAQKAHYDLLEDEENEVVSNGVDAAVVDSPPTNGHETPVNGSNGTLKNDLSYEESNDLRTLPDSVIEEYLSSKSITTEDLKSKTTKLRPITQFSYLPALSQDHQKAIFGTFDAPTPVQAAAWPYALSKRDVVGIAETGSGKTLAFGIPCMRYISSLGKKERKHVKAIMIAPTRELASQIHEQMEKLASLGGFLLACLYGGVPKDPQRDALKGASLIVATPGRLKDLMQEGSVDLSHVQYLVLDEADRMLDKGFEDDIRQIIEATPATPTRQTLMFTATWPPSVRALANSFMTDAIKITIGDNVSGELRANTRITQLVEVIRPDEKERRLFQLLKSHQAGKHRNDRILVFCLYKKEAVRVERTLARNFRVAAIHGDLPQAQRTAALERFKSGDATVLVATDVAARGLDIPAVKLVLNNTFPLTAEDYVHRIGRTGRAGNEGKAITLFTEHDKALAGALVNVLKAAKQDVPEALLRFGTTVKKKVHETYGAFYKDPSTMGKATKITFD